MPEFFCIFREFLDIIIERKYWCGGGCGKLWKLYGKKGVEWSRIVHILDKNRL